MSPKIHNNGYTFHNRLGDKSPLIHPSMNSPYGQPIVPFGQRSRKRTRSSLQMSNHRNDEESGNASYSKIDLQNTESLRTPAKLSFFERIIDKALLLDDGSPLDSNSGSSFLPMAIALLTIIATTSFVLTNLVSQVLFLSLFFIFSLPALYPSLLPWDDDDGDGIRDDSYNRNLLFDDAADEDTPKFKLYYFSIGYVLALFLTFLMKPLDFQPVEVVPADDSSLLSTTIVVIAVLGILSKSGLVDNQGKEVGIAEDEDDYVTLSGSAEESLMEIWDEKFRRNESPDDCGIDN